MEGGGSLSEFEFVIVLMSFIVAFGASEVLSGWGRQFLARAEARPYPLQLVASALLLVALLQTVWGYWGFRSVSWTFGSFLLALLPLLPLVGAAGIIMPPAAPSTSALDAKQHYLSVYRAIFLLLATWVALGTVAEIALVETTLHLGQGVRIAGVLLMVGLSLTSNPAVHWTGIALLAALQLAFVGTVTPELG